MSHIHMRDRYLVLLPCPGAMTVTTKQLQPQHLAMSAAAWKESTHFTIHTLIDHGVHGL